MRNKNYQDIKGEFSGHNLSINSFFSSLYRYSNKNRKQFYFQMAFQKKFANSHLLGSLKGGGPSPSIEKRESDIIISKTLKSSIAKLFADVLSRDLSTSSPLTLFNPILKILSLKDEDINSQLIAFCKTISNTLIKVIPEKENMSKYSIRSLSEIFSADQIDSLFYEYRKTNNKNVLHFLKYSNYLLSHKNLANVNLSGSNFTLFYLYKTNFNRADLRHANLNTVLSCTNLMNSNLLNVKFKRPRLPRNIFNKIVISEDSSLMIATNLDFHLYCWSLETMRLKFKVKAHMKIIKDIRFFPGELKIVTGSLDHYLKVWNAASGAFLNSINTESPICSILFIPYSYKILIGNSSCLKIWNLKCNSLEYESSISGRLISISRYRTNLASCTRNRNIEIVDLNALKLIRTLPGHKRITTCLKFSDTSDILYSSSLDMTIKAWDVESGCILYTYSCDAEIRWFDIRENLIILARRRGCCLILNTDTWVVEYVIHEKTVTFKYILWGKFIIASLNRRISLWKDATDHIKNEEISSLFNFKLDWIL